MFVKIQLLNTDKEQSLFLSTMLIVCGYDVFSMDIKAINHLQTDTLFLVSSFEM